MAEYRLYCINEQGRFSESHEIIADSDDAAIAKAEELKLPVKCELWQQARLVAALDPQEAERRAH